MEKPYVNGLVGALSMTLGTVRQERNRAPMLTLITGDKGGGKRAEGCFLRRHVRKQSTKTK
jgi:hypothetical protein